MAQEYLFFILLRHREIVYPLKLTNEESCTRGLFPNTKLIQRHQSVVVSITPWSKFRQVVRTVVNFIELKARSNTGIELMEFTNIKMQCLP